MSPTLLLCFPPPNIYIKPVWAVSLLYLSAKFLRCFKKFLHFRIWRSKSLPSGKAACMHNKAHMWQTTDWSGLRYKKRCKRGTKRERCTELPRWHTYRFPLRGRLSSFYKRRGKGWIEKNVMVMVGTSSTFALKSLAWNAVITILKVFFSCQGGHLSFWIHCYGVHFILTVTRC